MPNTSALPREKKLANDSEPFFLQHYCSLSFF